MDNLPRDDGRPLRWDDGRNTIPRHPGAATAHRSFRPSSERSGRPSVFSSLVPRQSEAVVPRSFRAAGAILTHPALPFDRIRFLSLPELQAFPALPSRRGKDANLPVYRLRSRRLSLLPWLIQSVCTWHTDGL